MKILSQILNGLSIGSIYALVALGYNMVYGIVKLINFAHGDIIMVGAYVLYLVMVQFGLPMWVAMLASIVFCALAGVIIEKVAYQRLLSKNVPRISLLITAIGVSIFLQNTAQLIFSSSSKSMPNLFPQVSFESGSLQVNLITLITIATTVVIMIFLQLLVHKTRIGKAMRATSEDAGAAKLMGINTKMVIAVTFGLGSALAAVGAVLYSGAYPQVNPYIGSLLGLKAFVAAVLGGIGSIPGAMLGGFILGIAESITKGLGASQFADAVVFGILILVLILKPSGLLGKHIDEKV